MSKHINIDEKLTVTYCIPFWLRDEQVKYSTNRIKARIEPVYDKRSDPIAVVCYGPSLNDTWEKIRDFKYIITCSGAHKFLIDRGIIPTFHCLHASSEIQTQNGPKTIKWIVDNQYDGKVLSMMDGKFVWKRITNHWSRSSRKLGKKWVKVNFCKVGNKSNLICTSDHRIAIIDDPLKPVIYYDEAANTQGKFAIRSPYSTDLNHRENPLFNPDQVSAMIGIMFGDGQIKADGIFRNTHGEPQTQYNEFKKTLFCGSIQSWVGFGLEQHWTRTTSWYPVNGQTKYLRKLMYPNGKKTIKNVIKYLDEIGLAFWYMDDGTLRDPNHYPYAMFCTDSFSHEDILLIIEHLKTKWGFDPQISACPTGERIRLRTGDSEKLFKIIAPYIHKDLHYKIPKQFLATNQYQFNCHRLEFSAEYIQKVEEMPVVRGKWHGGRLYDIEVEDSHNFVANHVVVHNCEVDPRPHKIQLIGQPHKDVEYLIASTCHKAVWDHLEGFNVKLWHVFANEEDALRSLPPNEWALTGGSSVGLRAMTIARFLGFTDLHIFGMDGCEGKSGKHAGEHPNQPKKSVTTVYEGVEYQTTASILECAKQTWHELDQMPDVKATFYGDGLVQAMSKNYVSKYKQGDSTTIGINKPELISQDYAELNSKLHIDNLGYGVGGSKYATVVCELSKSLKTTSILDYGCGKGYLAKSLPFPIWEYDPAIPGKTESPRPADIVICTDVLEHIEPEKLLFVLDDLRRCVKKVGYFVIHTGAAIKQYADGRNTHLIQKDKSWWKKKLSKFFAVGSIIEKLPELHVVVGPKKLKKAKIRVGSEFASNQV